MNKYPGCYSKILYPLLFLLIWKLERGGASPVMDNP